MSLLKKLAGETAVYGLSSIIGRLFNYVIMAYYLTREFSTDEYGVVSEMFAYAAFLMVFFTFRMETTFFRFASKKGMKERAFKTASSALVVTTILLAGGLLIFASPIAQYLGYPNHPQYIIAFVLIVAFDALAAIPFARLRLDNRPYRFAIIKILNIVFNIGFILFLLEGLPYLIENGWENAQNLYNHEGRIFFVFLANLIASFVTFLMLSPLYFQNKKEIELTGKTTIEKYLFEWPLFKQMMIYAAPLIIVAFAGIINEVLDRVLIKNILSDDLAFNLDQLGIYAGCYKLAVLMSLFTQAFNYAAEPFFFRNAEKSDSKEIYAQVAKAFTIVGALGFLIILFYIDFFKHIIDTEYHVGLKVVPLLLLANLLLGLSYNFSIWYKLTDNTFKGAMIAVVAAIVTILLNLLLIPEIGYMGAAYATLASYFTLAALSLLVGRKYYPVPYEIGRMLFYILLAIALYGFSQNFLIPSIPSSLFLHLIHGTIILAYTGLVFWLEKDSLVKVWRS